MDGGVGAHFTTYRHSRCLRTCRPGPERRELRRTVRRRNSSLKLVVPTVFLCITIENLSDGASMDRETSFLEWTIPKIIEGSASLVQMNGFGE